MAEAPLKEVLDKPDIQGLLRRGYGGLKAARFLLCRIEDAPKARAYLRGLVRKITPAVDDFEGRSAMHVAFTYPGLVELGLPASALATFPREFKEGMGEQGRAAVNGDIGENAPGEWTFGAPGQSPIHVILLVYAKRDTDARGEEIDADTFLQQLVDDEKTGFAGALAVVAEKDSRWLPHEKEHFGFRDGLSMSVAEGFQDGTPDPDGSRRPLKSGEFVLGYKNEYDHYTESPRVELRDDPDKHLLPTRDGEARDLGLNGAYLVYRQLEQRVFDFWKYLVEHSRERSDEPVDAAVRLAAKMVGRWPEGAPLVKEPHRDPGLSNDNNFGFWDDDKHGEACPLGSHIRRTNPRDHLPVDHGKSDSVEMVKKHQIIRRGRTFGEPLAASMRPADVLAAGGDDGKPRGLHFICLVGHIHRQFEFMQNAWVKSPVFGGLTAETDPLIGVRAGSGVTNDEFTCPAQPLRRKYRELPQFTKLLGGGYFFLPGLRALRYIASDRVGR